MNWKNPTGIRIGMTGRFFGRTYHVIGFAVLGVMDGKIYYWNEYYLKADGVEIATLVYEPSGWGGEWRWFTQFDPEAPLTAREAASKRWGDYVTIDDNTAKIMLVRDSRVYHVEGQAPEGVRVGARANYFNAKDSTTLFVVSWTGEEVEFYRGTNLTSGTVAFGFNVKMSKLVPSEIKARLVWTTIGVTAIVMLIAIVYGASEPSRQSGIAIVKLPAPALKPGAAGRLRGINYQITGHAEIKIEEVGSVLIRHEYFLHGEDGDVLLIYGWNRDKKDWLLFTPMHASVEPTPQEAARMKLGNTMLVGGVTAKINELFRSTVLDADGTNDSSLYSGVVRYGLVGQAGPDCVLARWNEQGIMCSEGKPIQESEVTAAFSSASAK
jgi:Domain of unknown function (DUF4178)